MALVAGAVLLRLSALNVGVESTGLAWNLRYAGEGTEPGPVDAALARARAEHKPVMIDFFAEWCAACNELDRETYVAPTVAFVSSEGKVLDDPRVTGFLGPEKFTEALRQVR